MALLQIFTKQIECVTRVFDSTLLDFYILSAEEHRAVLTLFNILFWMRKIVLAIVSC